MVAGEVQNKPSVEIRQSIPATAGIGPILFHRVFHLGPDGQGAAEIYQVKLPGLAQGWTPAVERCLEPGARYAWALRAVDSRGQAGPWSDARLFEISAVPTFVINGEWAIPGAQDPETFVSVLRRLNEKVAAEAAADDDDPRTCTDDACEV